MLFMYSCWHSEIYQPIFEIRKPFLDIFGCCNMSPPVILSNTEVLMQIKDKSRALYIRIFNMLREFVGDQLETRSTSEEEIMRFIKHLREEKEMASSTVCTNIAWSLGSVEENTTLRTSTARIFLIFVIFVICYEIQ